MAGERRGEGRQPGWGLGRRHDEAGTNSLLVIPQLAYLQREGSPGRFAERDFFDDFLEELLEKGVSHRLGGPRALGDVERITLVAHSAGFKTALAILQRSSKCGEKVKDVVLFDALYAAPALFARWVADTTSQGRKIVSIHTGAGRTKRFSLMLAGYLRELIPADEVDIDPVDLGESIRRHRAVIARTKVGHGAVPSRYLKQVVSSLGLRERNGAGDSQTEQ